MPLLPLSTAQRIVTESLAHARLQGYQPLAVAVLDVRGVLIAYAAEDGTSLLRYQLSFGKAFGALGMGYGTAELERRAEHRPQFMQALTVASQGRVVPARGGVLIRDAQGELLGAVGVSGDQSPKDEAAAMAGIAAAGLLADPG
jgi:uncharacterized protein GlcG (DUF336 family)